jgi:hypothetical protein
MNHLEGYSTEIPAPLKRPAWPPAAGDETATAAMMVAASGLQDI